MLQKITDLHDLARGHKKKKLVLAAAQDANALEAAVNASRNGITDVILVGDQKEIKEICSRHELDIAAFELLHEPDVEQAAALSVKLVSQKEGDILMKGLISTSLLLKAVLNKEWGLRSGDLLSHFSLFEVDSYHKIIGLTDAAMNIAPDLKAKVSIIKNSVYFMRKLGIDRPKVALLSAVETINPDMKSGIEAAVISKMAERGQIKNCVIDGPFALDNAISSKSAKLKGIYSPVAGDADLLVGDDIDASNTLYKSLIYFAHAKCAAIILGAAAPIVLTSRSDSDETKMNSIALAASVDC